MCGGGGGGGWPRSTQLDSGVEQGLSDWHAQQEDGRCREPGVYIVPSRCSDAPGPPQIGDKDIDDLLNDMGALGQVAAYVADPPLVRPGEEHARSQIELQPGDG